MKEEQTAPVSSAGTKRQKDDTNKTRIAPAASRRNMHRPHKERRCRSKTPGQLFLEANLLVKNLRTVSSYHFRQA